MRTLSERIEIFKSSDLYPVVSSEFCNGRNVCDIVADIASGGAGIVQIREKNISLPEKGDISRLGHPWGGGPQSAPGRARLDHNSANVRECQALAPNFFERLWQGQPQRLPGSILAKGDSPP